MYIHISTTYCSVLSLNDDMMMAIFRSIGTHNPFKEIQCTYRAGATPDTTQNKFFCFNVGNNKQEYHLKIYT